MTRVDHLFVIDGKDRPSPLVLWLKFTLTLPKISSMASYGKYLKRVFDHAMWSINHCPHLQSLLSSSFCYKFKWTNILFIRRTSPSSFQTKKGKKTYLAGIQWSSSSSGCEGGSRGNGRNMCWRWWRCGSRYRCRSRCSVSQRGWWCPHEVLQPWIRRLAAERGRGSHTRGTRPRESGCSLTNPDGFRRWRQRFCSRLWRSIRYI
jgi:hypothetical protein